MTEHSYTGIRAIMASGMKVSGGKLESAETNAQAGLRKALARGSRVGIAHLTGAEIASQLTDEQKTALRAKLGLSAAPAKAAAPKISKADLDRARAEGYAQGRAEIRAGIKQVLDSPDSRGVEREAMTALAAGAIADRLLADLADRNTLVANMRARYATPAPAAADAASTQTPEQGTLASAMKARFEGGAA